MEKKNVKTESKQNVDLNAVSQKKMGFTDFVNETRLRLDRGLHIPVFVKNEKSNLDQEEVPTFFLAKFYHDPWSGIPMYGCYKGKSFFSVAAQSVYNDKASDRIIENFVAEFSERTEEDNLPF